MVKQYIADSIRVYDRFLHHHLKNPPVFWGRRKLIIFHSISTTVSSQCGDIYKSALKPHETSMLNVEVRRDISDIGIGSLGGADLISSNQ